MGIQWSGAAMAPAILVSCLGAGPKETGDTAPVDTGPDCPYSLAAYCEYEFGGPCPDFATAAAMKCDGVHFTNGSGTEPLVREEGDDSCPFPRVQCLIDGPHTSTMFFNGSRELLWVVLDWPDTDVCPIDITVDAPLC